MVFRNTKALPKKHLSYNIMVSKFSDVAVGLSEDKLGFRDYADGVIARLERLSKEDTPFTIGIFGSWGSGKTSFMQIMQELLQGRGYETIFFKSWEYGNEEKLWIPFMIKVVDELFKDEIDKKELIRNIFLFSTDVVLKTLSQGEISSGDILDVYERSKKTCPFKEWSNEDAKIVIERVTKIKEFKKRIEERTEKSYLFSIVEEKLFSCCKLINEKNLNNGVIPKKLKKTFKTKGLLLSDDARIMKEKDDEWVIEGGEWIYVVKKEDGKINIYERAKKEKIIIFIDDLDRIPEKIVDFLNSLKTFLDISGCIFVLGCDYEILDSALKQKYKGEIYEDYFDKIVQTDFYVPKIGEQAIKDYLQFLTGWNAKEIEECTQLVNHSIGGNPRKIKRVVNATMLIKSVFEKRLDTVLKAFERPKLRIPIGPKEEVKEEELEEAMTLKRKISMTPAEVFDHVFEKKVLFKLMCMREQWPAYYEDILSDEEKQKDLISLQDGNITTDSWEYTELFSTAKDLKALEGNVKKLSHFLQNSPRFQGENRLQRADSLKTYLTLLEISSPEAGISLEYTEPAGLPINLFNRYMLFERINRGKVEKTVIEEKVKQVDWKDNLSSYAFFFEVISSLGYKDLLQDLFRKYTSQSQSQSRITNEIKSSSDLWAIGRLFGIMRGVEEETARVLLKETSDTYAEKIRACSDPEAIGRLLFYVRKIDEETARRLLNRTKNMYAEKIRACSDPEAIGRLLDVVRGIKEKTAEELLNETSDTIAEKIRACSDPGVIGWLLGIVGRIKEEIAEEHLNETSDTIAEKIRTCSDPGVIGWLLDSVRRIEEETARRLLNRTKNTYAEKIRACSDPEAIGRLLFYVREIEKETARVLLNETWNTYAEKIKDRTDPYSIERLLFAVRKIENETAQKLLNKTKDTIAEKIRACSDPEAIGRLLGRVLLIEEGTARVLLIRTKNTYAEKIRACTDPAAIGMLLYQMKEIKEETARIILNRTKNTYAEKIIASSDPRAISGLLYYVREIEEETARVLFNRTSDTYAEKIIASTDPEAIGMLLYYVSVIEEGTAKDLLNRTKNTYAKKIIASTDPWAIGMLLYFVSSIEKGTARVLLKETSDTYAKKIIASMDPEAIGKLLYYVREIEEETAKELLNETSDTYAKKIIASSDLRAIEKLLDSVREIEKRRARILLSEIHDTIAEKIKASTSSELIKSLLDSISKIDNKTAKRLKKETKFKSEEK